MGRGNLRYAPSLIVAGLVLFGVYFLVQLVVMLREIVTVLMLGVVLGIALAPMAEFLTRFKIPRPASVLLFYLLVGGVLAVITWVSVPQISSELEELPDRLAVLRDDYESFSEGSGLPTPAELEQYGRDVLNYIAPELVSQALTAFTVLAYVLTVLVVAVFFTQIEKPAAGLIVSLFSHGTREKAADVMAHTARRLRSYVIGELISMSIIGLLVYIGLTILGIPFPFLLAVIAFLTELLPIIGPWIGFVPALLLAATEGWQSMVIVSIFYVVLQQIESNVIQPLVMKHQTELPALLVLAAVLIGGALMGVLGALVALPLAIVIQTFMIDVVIPWRQRDVGTLPTGDDEDASSEPVAGGDAAS